jgi:hypothetical protein
MRMKVHYNSRKIIQSLQSAQVGGHVQIAVVENRAAEADAVRQ